MPKSKGKFIPTKYKRQYARNAYDSITVFVPKGEKEIIKTRAVSLGLSMNEYIKQAIYHKMETEDEQKALENSTKND